MRERERDTETGGERKRQAIETSENRGEERLRENCKKMEERVNYFFNVFFFFFLFYLRPTKRFVCLFIEQKKLFKH